MVADLPIEDRAAGFEDYADAVPDGDVVVGHSMGGITASIVARRRGCPVVYVAALLPRAGVALAPLIPSMVFEMRFERRDGLDFFEEGEARDRGLDPAHLRGQAPTPYFDVLDDPAPGRYIGCRHDRVVRPEYQATVADAWLECGHTPQVECPEALAALL